LKYLQQMLWIPLLQLLQQLNQLFEHQSYVHLEPHLFCISKDFYKPSKSALVLARPNALKGKLPDL
jgi:hypothetical protein